MTASRQRRQLLDRLRSRTDATTTPEPVALPAPPVAPPEPEPPRRERLFGSQYRVRMSFAELIQTRGYTGERVFRGLRMTETTDDQRQRDARDAPHRTRAWRSALAVGLGATGEARRC